ncbi:MAG: methenyltetrahydromethanopterin cyclohydrolase [Actinobacteria bacterium]|nr:methenyltetrahydromethanopterin cyclohydrolase [Actinomycetota bacterium]NIS31757.1 methenyltetrahydromethanopterin cyclohydrolase [Actinomycetota bacterium]NIU66854.1 methenyltetrahydromethanopterin cyclohydrolase [Actinomycetota bacterium]NIV87456.1 methenyltetrahydromethanopterin cyclohydrolase [Actinomycetota bacterium]NIW28654.1 methenyltetrahydromethanopterin cyclohydrolase [Actinomycetota bacterium]
MISVNREAMKTVRVILEEADALGVEVDRLDNGATVVDMGLRAKGGWRAGRLYTLVTIGGLGEVSYEPFAVAGRMLSAVRVMIDHPVEGCVASQIAGWRLEAPGKEHAAILAGPGRALNRESLDHYFDWVDYRDDHHEAVVAIQASEPVTEELADMIATSCRVAPDDLYVLLAPNRSLVCAVQVAARIVEQTIHRLAEEGMDLRCLRHAYGFGVVPPLVDDDLVSMGRINDSLLYGGIANLAVDTTDEACEAVIDKVISEACPAYGRPFIEIYEDAGRDFYEIPIELHSPAEVHLDNVATGRTFSSGRINHAVLEASFFP